MKTILFSFFAFSFALSVNASVEDDFSSANESYKQGEYKSAKKKYLSLIEGNTASATIYYNLGNVCYKLHEVAPAILYYEKAHKLAPSNQDVSHNLTLANLLAVDKLNELKEEAIGNWWAKYIHSQSANQWALYSILFSLFTAGLFLVFLFSQQRLLKQIGFYGAVTGTLFTLIVLITGSNNQSKSSSSAIVFHSPVAVFSEPNKTATQLFNLHEGAKVEVLSEENDWKRIRFSAKKIGWLKSETIVGI